jgi:hypothetical protein
LPAPWDEATTLTGKFHEHVIHRNAEGQFVGLTAGIYHIS